MLICASTDLVDIMSYGSQRGFRYEDDGGTVWALRLDESNTELINPASAGVVPNTGTRRLPPEIRRRKVKLQAADSSTKTVVVLTRARYDAIALGQTFAAPAVGEENVAGTAFTVVQKIPERVLNSVVTIDTGKTDGDQP